MRNPCRIPTRDFDLMDLFYGIERRRDGTDKLAIKKPGEVFKRHCLRQQDKLRYYRKNLADLEAALECLN